MILCELKQREEKALLRRGIRFCLHAAEVQVRRRVCRQSRKWSEALAGVGAQGGAGCGAQAGLFGGAAAIDSLRFPLTLSSPVGPLSQMSVRSDVVTCLSVGREDALWHLMRRVWPALLPLCPLGLEAAAVGEGEPRGGRRPGPFVRLECCSSGNRLLLTCSLYSYLVCISAL